MAPVSWTAERALVQSSSYNIGPQNTARVAQTKQAGPCNHQLYILPSLFMLYTQGPPPLPRPVIQMPHYRTLMLSLLFLRLLLKPIEFLARSSTSLSLSLDLNSRCLVCLQLIRNVCLLWGLGGFWRAELLDVAFGVGGFDGGRFVGFQFAEVEVLDEVRWEGNVSRGFGSIEPRP